MDSNKFRFRDNTLKKKIQPQKRNGTNERHILLRQQLGMKDTLSEQKETLHTHDHHTNKISVESATKKELPRKEPKEKMLKPQKQPEPKLNKKVERIMKKMKQIEN